MKGSEKLRGWMMFMFAVIILSATPPAYGFMIDQFTDVETLNVNTLSCASNQIPDALPDDIIGTDRHIVVCVNSTSGNSLNLNIGSDHLLYTQGTGVNGFADVNWGDCPGDNCNVSSLGGVDLTESGTQGSLRVRVNSNNQAVNITFFVYTDATHSSEATMPFTIINSPSFVYIPYSIFSKSGGAAGPANFSNVGFIRMRIIGTPGQNLNIDFVDTSPQLTSVPTFTEWGMIIFLVFAGLGAVYFMRRQKTAKS